MAVKYKRFEELSEPMRWLWVESDARRQRKLEQAKLWKLLCYKPQHFYVKI